MKNWKYIEGAKTGNIDINDMRSEKEKITKQIKDLKDERAGWLRYQETHKDDAQLAEKIKGYTKEISDLQNKLLKVGNISADITTDGNTWFVTTSDGKKKEFTSEREAEAYVKKIKTGNAFDFETRMVVEKKEELKTAEDELRKAEADRNRHKGERYWEEAYITAKKDVERAKENLARAQRNKTGNDTPWEYAHRKPKVINEDKTGAEEFFKQLSDDVKEREEKDDKEIKLVGNASLETSVEKGRLGMWNWYIYKDGNIVAGGTTYTEAAAKEMARKALEKEKAGNKVGNFKTGTSQLKPGDKVMSFGKKGTVKEVIGENTDNIYGEPLIKVEFEDGTTKTISEHYMRKVGNKTTQVAQVGTVKILYDDKDNVYYTNVGGSIFNNPSFKTKEEAVKYTVQKNKAGNKTGNARYTTREDVISHLDTDLYDICKKVPAGSPSFAYVSELQKKGWDISTISKYTKEIGKIIDQYKVGNSKTGNATPNYRYKDFLITNPEGHEYIVFLKDGRTVGYRGTTSKAQAEDWCDWHDPKTGKSIGNKVGNEASDDKFAYVMREFDEGKLKTPDGKVVTDPAQAKAITYSESKKTENGLARARNAMAGNWNSDRNINPVGKYREFIRDLKNAIMLDVAAVTYNNVDEQTLKSWVEQAKKEGFGSAIKGVQGKKVILDVY